MRQVTPNWFTATMGAGILALPLHQFPSPISELQAPAEGVRIFNSGVFILFAVLYGARWVFFFHEAGRVFGHSVVSMFFGVIPMGLATIINGLLPFGPGRFGEAATWPGRRGCGGETWPWTAARPIVGAWTGPLFVAPRLALEAAS